MTESCTMGDSDWAPGSIYWDHWNRLPWEVTDTPRLSVFKRHLDCALNSMFGQSLSWGSCFFFSFVSLPLWQNNPLWSPRAVGSGNAAAVGTRTVLGVGHCVRGEQQQHWGLCHTTLSYQDSGCLGPRAALTTELHQCHKDWAFPHLWCGVGGVRNTLVRVEQLLRQEVWREFSDGNCGTQAWGCCQNYPGWSPPPLDCKNLGSLWEALLSQCRLSCWVPEALAVGRHRQRALEGTLSLRNISSQECP